VEGWHPVEDVVRRGFGQAQVVMAHEAGGSLADTLAGLGGTAGALLTEDGA
jgi:hypothetical protein